jgi:hypothetical protein
VIFTRDPVELFFGRELSPLSGGGASLDLPPLPFLQIQEVTDGLVHDLIDGAVGLLGQAIEGSPCVVFEVDGDGIGHRGFFASMRPVGSGETG